MKRTFLLLIFIASLTACENYRYDDFITDFDYTAVYFPFQELERSFVYGEFDQIKVAVQMGGKRENNVNEWVEYIIDETVTVDSSLTLLSPEYYTLSDDSRFPMPPGSLGGELILTVSKEFFERADTTRYYIPFRLMSTSLDSILESKQTMILTLNTEAAKFGNYYHNGVTQVDSVNGNKRTITYHQKEPVTNAVNNWALTTAAYDTLITDGISNRKAGAINYSFKMVLNADNSVDIYPNMASEWLVKSNGTSEYDPDKMEFYLNYSFQDANGNDYSAMDTLIFRNRILDGVNQWDL